MNMLEATIARQNGGVALDLGEQRSQLGAEDARGAARARGATTAGR